MSWKTIYHRFSVWAHKRVFDHVFHELARKYVGASSAKVLVTDTTFVKNILGKRDQVTGRNRTDRGRQTTKVSMLCDSAGLPLHYALHRGNKADCTLLRHLLLASFQSWTLLADKGYDSQTRPPRPKNIETSTQSHRQFQSLRIESWDSMTPRVC